MTAVLNMPVQCLKRQTHPSGADLLLGAAMLELVSEWDRWVHRRVDSLRFAGEDETVLERRHSMDFTLPPEIAAACRELLGGSTGLVPVTFMNKWRLPHLSVRDEGGRAIPLLERRDHIRISAAMLISMAYQIVTGTLGPARGGELMPADLAWELCGITAEDPGIAIGICTALAEPRAMLPDAALDAASRRWREQLVVDPAFMELAFELAHGFPLLVICPQNGEARRVVKLSYDWPLAHPLGLSLIARARSIPRRLRPGTDPRRWLEDAKKGQDRGTLVLSTVCTTLNVEARASDTGLPCAEVTLRRPWRLPLRRRMRPNVATSLEFVPAGEYRIEVRKLPGFDLVEPAPPPLVAVRPGEVARIPIHARQHDVVRKPELTRGGPTQPASLWYLFQRGIAVRSKPLMIRLRLGDGGARHFEFEGPPGMQVTRAKLVADRRHESEDDAAELDLVLESRQRSHLYAPAGSTTSESGYAFLNLRPRVETIIRSAVLTAGLTALAMGLFAVFWLLGTAPNLNPGALVLGIPVVLSAYFAQSVQSRVTQAMLYGVRITALLPALLGAVAAALLLLAHSVGQPSGTSTTHPTQTVARQLPAAAGKTPRGRRTGRAATPSRQPATSNRQSAPAGNDPLIDAELAKILFAVTALLALGVAGLLGLSQWGAIRPPEQAWTDSAQGDGHRLRYLRRRSARPQGPPSTPPAEEYPPGATVAECAAQLRDRLLERSVGMSRQTRDLLFRRRWSAWFMNPEVPSALYFDAAETVPIFRGMRAGAVRDGVRDQIANAGGRWSAMANDYDMLIRGPHGYTRD